MKYTENRKITACVTRDRDSLERINLWALFCVMCFFFIFTVVTIAVFSFKFACAEFHPQNKFFVWQSQKQTDRRTDWESDFNYYLYLKPVFSALYETLGFLAPRCSQLCVRDRRLVLPLIKTFQFVACYGTKCSHHIIILTGNRLLAHFLLAAHHQQNIPLGLSGTPSKELIELNCINMTYCMSFQPEKNIAL